MRLVTLGAPLQMDTPLIPPSDFAWSSNAVNPLAYNRNKYGDKGSPCLIP